LQELAAKAADLTGQNERTIFEILLQRRSWARRCRQRHRHPARQAAEAHQLFGLFAAWSGPDRLRGARRSAGIWMFLLLAPEGAGADHLKALARVARLLRDPDCRAQAARVARCASALCRADAGGERGVMPI